MRKSLVNWVQNPVDPWFPNAIIQTWTSSQEFTFWPRFALLKFWPSLWPRFWQESYLHRRTYWQVFNFLPVRLPTKIPVTRLFHLATRFSQSSRTMQLWLGKVMTTIFVFWRLITTLKGLWSMKDEAFLISGW